MNLTQMRHYANGLACQKTKKLDKHLFQSAKTKNEHVIFVTVNKLDGYIIIYFRWTRIQGLKNLDSVLSFDTAVLRCSGYQRD